MQGSGGFLDDWSVRSWFDPGECWSLMDKPAKVTSRVEILGEVEKRPTSILFHAMTTGMESVRWTDSCMLSLMTGAKCVNTCLQA